MQTTCEWLVCHMPQVGRPPDADYPVWLSLCAENAMLLSQNTVILELEVDNALITRINMAKWGIINNFSYISADEADAARHSRLLASYGVSDTKACMSQFYPGLKREIEDSWMRLFDESIQLEGTSSCSYGLIWEVKHEWIRRIIR